MQPQPSGRATFLPFALPSIDDDDVDEVIAVLRSGWLTAGPRIELLEREFAATTRSAAALALNSGTAAMHLALTVLRIEPGRAVVTTPLTFCSTAHVIEQVGCRPLFVDIDPSTLNVDPCAVRAAVEDRPDDVGAILPVHYGGHPCDLGPILDLARDHELPVVEDAAHALGAEYDGRPVGEVGPGEHRRAVCFSLYATKNITSGEGGLLTASAELVATARLWSLHGMSRDSWQRYGPRGSWSYEVVVPGFKYNMSDIQAALAVSQLRRWRALQQRRTEIAARYSAQLGGIEELETPTAKPGVTHAWHLYPLRLNLEWLTVDREVFIEELRERNSGTSVHFIPLHMQPYYRDRYGYHRDDFPVAAAEFDRLVSLPIYPRMTDADVDDVCAAVVDVVGRNLRRGRRR